MAQFNENITLAAPNPLDKRYSSERTLGGSQLPYSGLTEVYSTIPETERYSGLTVLINTGTTSVEYWFTGGVSDSHLVQKNPSQADLVGEFVTGATNIGFFSGMTEVQTLPITHGSDPTNYSGNYSSLYNWFYRGTDGGIHVGTPSDGIPKRGYVKTSYPVKSWIWNDYTASGGNLEGWILVDGNINNQLGTFQTGVVYYNGTTTFPHIETGYTGGVNYPSLSNVSISAVIGNLTGGTSISIGGPVYSNKSDAQLYYRTIKSATPVTLGVTYDEAFVYVSGATSILTAENTGTTGAGTAGVYDSKTDNTLFFRRIIGSGDTQVSQVGHNIILYSTGGTGSINVDNVGSGAGEVYSGTSGTTMLFRTILGSGDTTVTTSGDTIIVNSEGGGVNGSVFISDITPQSTGNVGSKTFSSDGEVLDDCTTDTQLVIVSVFALPGNTNYNPVVRINGVQVSLTPESDAPLFSGTINVDLSGATEITVIHEDGAEHTVYITQEVPPVVLAANFINGYPASQTELKENDTFDFYVESDVPVVAVELDDFEAYQSGVYSVSSGTGHTVTGDIADRGDVAQNQTGRVRVQKSTGSWSAWFTTSGLVDGTGYVVLNNLYPTITFGVINYPATQSALKDSETATVNHTVIDYNTILYSSPNSELSISNTSTYEAAKTAQRIAGGYNITTDNFRIVANRTANDATTTDNEVVWIAHDSQVISVSTPAARLRSGGNDGTTAQDHTITIGSTQRLASAPTLVAPIGTWQGAGFSWSAVVTSFTRDIQINDNMTKGTYSWGALATTNLAGKSVTTITTGTNYTLGGFVSRDISLAAFAYTANMNVEAITANKVTLSWSFEPLVVNQQSVGTDIPPPVTNGWSLSALASNPTIIRILDSKTSASSQASTITIQEAI